MVTLEHPLHRDEELVERIHLALIDLQPVNLLALPSVRAAVEGGRVTLSGNVATVSQAAAIARTVAELPGVTTVVNELVDDGTLTLDAWSALASLPELLGIDRRLRLVFGTIYVDWAVRMPALESLAGEVLASLPGVRQVVHGEWPESEYQRGTAA